MKKNILMALCAIATIQSVLPNAQQTPIQQEQSWIESGVETVDTGLRFAASTVLGAATGILSGYGVKAVLKMLHMNNEITPKTGTVFALLSLGVLSKEYYFRKNLVNRLTKNVSPKNKALIKNIGTDASWFGFLLVGLNPNSMFPGL